MATAPTDIQMGTMNPTGVNVAQKSTGAIQEGMGRPGTETGVSGTGTSTSAGASHGQEGTRNLNKPDAVAVTIQADVDKHGRGDRRNFDSDTNLLLAVAALIITLSFAAVLQPPGGINTDTSTPESSLRKIGQANLLVGDTTSFWIFFISNGTAMAAASVAILLLLACPDSGSYGYQRIVLGKSFVALAIPASLVSFCAAVWIIVGRDKTKVLPFFIAAVMLFLCVPVYVITLFATPRPQSAVGPHEQSEGLAIKRPV